jgi:hypothetical protein
MRRHIDFFAVFFIAVVMIGFSQARNLTLPDMPVVRANNVLVTSTNNESCPIAREILASIDSFLNQ